MHMLLLWEVNFDKNFLNPERAKDSVFSLIISFGFVWVTSFVALIALGRRLLEDAGAAEGDDPAPDFVTELLGRCTDPDASSLVAELCNSPMPEITDETIRIQLKTLLERQAREGARRLEPAISEAEQRGDHDEVDRLLAEKTRLRRELAEI